GHANDGDVHANAAEKTAKETKEKAKKQAAEKAEKEKREAAKKNKQAAKKNKKEKSEKEDAERKKAEMRKAAAEKKEQAESVDVLEATTVPKSLKSLKVQQKMFGKGQENAEKPKGKRITKPSVYLKSPFMNNMVKTQDKLDEDEIICTRSVFCMQGDISEIVFDDEKGTIAHRKEMQSLEERIRTDGKDLRRRYFPTDAVFLNEDKDQAKQYESFENVIKNQMNGSELKKKMKDVELAFFLTVVVSGQYYVIFFNLLKANAVILDNEKHDDYNNYKGVFDSVKHQHPCVEKLSKDKAAKVLKMKWKTEKNNIDSGLYLMMHIELYQGESTTNWKTEQRL
ncbi:hypothetical protein Tco_0482519, partial [Tanacetum coccineum]